MNVEFQIPTEADDLLATDANVFSVASFSDVRRISEYNLSDMIAGGWCSDAHTDANMHTHTKKVVLTHRACALFATRAEATKEFQDGTEITTNSAFDVFFSLARYFEELTPSIKKATCSALLSGLSIVESQTETETETETTVSTPTSTPLSTQSSTLAGMKWFKRTLEARLGELSSNSSEAQTYRNAIKMYTYLISLIASQQEGEAAKPTQHLGSKASASSKV